jgi:hypothetical protein
VAEFKLDCPSLVSEAKIRHTVSREFGFSQTASKESHKPGLSHRDASANGRRCVDFKSRAEVFDPSAAS